MGAAMKKRSWERNEKVEDGYTGNFPMDALQFSENGPYIQFLDLIYNFYPHQRLFQITSREG